MINLKTIKNLAPVLLAVFLYGCPAKEVNLPGDIYGRVQDAVTKEPVLDAEVKLFLTNDSLGTDTTGVDGTFLFTNLEPEDYSVEVNKDLYDKHTEDIYVFSAKTSDLDIIIRGTPRLEFSEPWLNFGMESTRLSFYISNTGGGILSYEIILAQDWISVSKDAGEITKEPDLIEVTIDREGLREESYKALIAIHSEILGDIQVDNLDIYVNYVMDRDSILYRTVRIGDQVWMADNLNTGIMVEAPREIPTTNNGIIEKLCYKNDPQFCEVYGGLYMWDEMMDYPLVDTAGMRIIQGICPEGWHVPTLEEWVILREHLGGEQYAGGKLKDTSHLWWINQFGEADNESGFSALPAGMYRLKSESGEEIFEKEGERANFWTTYYTSGIWKTAQLTNFDTRLMMIDISHRQSYPNAMSVRCVQDP